MVKIAILVVGIVRENISSLLKNIKCYKENFKNHDYKVYFSTWKIKESMANELKEKVDYFEMIDEPTDAYIEKNIISYKKFIIKK